MAQPASKANLWIIFASLTVIVIMLTAFRWSLEHPYGTSWDEAEYINQVFYDAQRLEHGMLLKLAGRILVRSSIRPPAYRPLALPFVVLFGFHAASPRLLSLLCFAFACWFVYRTTRRIVGGQGGAFAVLIFGLSPVVVSACRWYSTEGPLYLATSAFLYYLFVLWTENAETSRAWVGLGLASGLGFLSKASFPAVAVPVLAYWIVATRWKRLAAPSLAPLMKAAVLTFFIAGPWWLINFLPAIQGVHSARAFVANSLGPPSLATWGRWLETVVESLLGHGITLLILLVTGVWIWKGVVRKQTFFSLPERALAGACACAGLPIIFAQLIGTNDLLRHISPAVIPLAIVLGMLSVKMGWVNSAGGVVLSILLLGAQLLMIMTPVVFPNKAPLDAGLVNAWLPWRVFALRDQWDWSPLYGISVRCGLDDPAIAFLGFGQGLAPDLLRYPWVLRAARSSAVTLDYPDVTWLWRYEEGPINWSNVMETAGKADVVLTLPGYMGVGEEDLANNPHNSDFAERLTHDPRFQGPFRFEVGRFTPIKVQLFVRKAADCRVDQDRSNDR